MSSPNPPGPAEPTHGPDPYAVLGVPPDATPAQITTAFRRLARALHPDTSAGPSGPPGLDDVLAAYQTLHDPARRTAHDRTRRPPATPDRPAATPSPSPNRQPVDRRAAPDIVAGPPRRHGTDPLPTTPLLVRVGPVIQIRGPGRGSGR
jgi:curved DNA-binding protein CbpA